jgi:hypothetical protein
MRRQVHVRYCGQLNRKGRKVVNLRLSTWKRKHGIPAHEQLPPMDYLKAAYGDEYDDGLAPGGRFILRSPLLRMIARAQ